MAKRNSILEENAEYARMKFNISVIPRNQRCIDHFPELKKFEEVFMAKDKVGDPDLVLRYIILLYSPHSPAESIPDLKKRKIWALKDVLKVEEPFSQSLKDMVQWKDEVINRKAVIFMWIVGGARYLMYKQAAEEIMAITTTEIKYDGADLDEQKKNADIQKVKRENLTKAAAELENSQDLFLRGEKSVELEKALAEFVLSESLQIRPEEYVRIWQNSGKVFQEYA